MVAYRTRSILSEKLAQSHVTTAVFVLFNVNSKVTLSCPVNVFGRAAMAYVFLGMNYCSNLRWMHFLPTLSSMIVAEMICSTFRVTNLWGMKCHTLPLFAPTTCFASEINMLDSMRSKVSVEKFHTHSFGVRLDHMSSWIIRLRDTARL